MLPTGVVGVITVGVDGRVVRSAKATVPFLARLTGQGVESGDANPLIVRFNVPVPVPHAFVAVSVTVNVPGLVGMPEMFPLLVFIDKPWGRELALKLVGLWFVLDVREHGTPVVTDCVCMIRRKVWRPDTPTSMISLSSKGYFGASLRVGRVGRVAGSSHRWGIPQGSYRSTRLRHRRQRHIFRLPHLARARNSVPEQLPAPSPAR